jgi:hypothetical protein
METKKRAMQFINKVWEELVVSSSTQRLKPHVIDIRANIGPVHWFLIPTKDTHSSMYLEDLATAFQVQGPELDWTIVTWAADLCWTGDEWSHHNFRRQNGPMCRSPSGGSI